MQVPGADISNYANLVFPMPLKDGIQVDFRASICKFTTCPGAWRPRASGIVQFGTGMSLDEYKGVFGECRAGGRGAAWLCGVLHFGHEGMYPLPEPLERAFAEADEIFFETDMDVISGYGFSRRLHELGTYGGQGCLREELSCEVWECVVEVARGLGYSEATVDNCRPWYCASMLTSSALQKAGFSSRLGIDGQLFMRASSEGRRIMAFETPDEQLELLSSLGADDPDGLVSGAMAEIREMERFSGGLYRLWRVGDWDGLEALIRTGMRGGEEEQTRILLERNRKWTERLLAELAGGANVLAVIGAAHVIGENGICRMLSDRLAGHVAGCVETT